MVGVKWIIACLRIESKNIMKNNDVIKMLNDKTRKFGKRNNFCHFLSFAIGKGPVG
jgi:hypothetical protein